MDDPVALATINKWIFGGGALALNLGLIKWILINEKKHYDRAIQELSKRLKEHESEDTQYHDRDRKAELQRLERLKTLELTIRPERIEGVAKRVHTLESQITASLMACERIPQIEDRLDKTRSDSGDMRVQVAQLSGNVKELSTRVEVNGSFIGDRMESIEITLRNLSDTFTTWLREQNGKH